FFTYASIVVVALFVIWSLMQLFVDRLRAKAALKILAVSAITFAAAFAILFFACGFNIIACVKSSMSFDAELMHSVRSAYWDVSATNLLGLLVGSGFITSTLWMRSALRGRRSECQRLCAAMGLTVLILSFSTLFTRELERIWMFLTPLLLIGAACEL